MHPVGTADEYFLITVVCKIKDSAMFKEAADYAPDSDIR